MEKEKYNDFYKKHGAGVHSDAVRFMEIAKLCKGKVLDIACGTGDLADYYKGEYLGLDISDVAIDLARETRRKDAEFAIGNPLETLENCGEKFDTIVLAEFLEHIENDSIIFQNVKKLAKENARIIITVPNGDRVPDANHVREFTVPGLRKKFFDLGKITFIDWLGFKDRILMTIDLNEKNENLLTLAMIVWNEAKGLEKAILSCIGFIDKIVISVDNKSDDETLEIAKKYADVLKRHEWENNFAKARNFVDEGITSKYILSLDGHEFVKQAPEIKEKLKIDTGGFRVRIEMENGDDFLSPRLYKTGSVWEHAIHNALKLKEAVNYTDFIITHDRLGGQSEKSTALRIEQVRKTMEAELKKELKIKGSEVRALFYLARYYRQFLMWKKALRFYKKYLRKSKHKAEKWLCAYEAGVIANTMGKTLLALRFFEKANKEIPNRWEIKKHIGLTYMTFNQWNKALIYLIESLDVNTGQFTFNPEKRDDGETWDNIGFCFFQLGKYFEAKQAWEQAVKIGTNEVQVAMNKKRIEMLERQWGV